MSYLVIARKWRPQNFSEVVGQSHVTRTLQNAIRSKRIAHAYLFSGARGVGKTSVARIMAKALNCERDLPATACNECSNCREITQGNAVDVIEIDGASNRGIDSIRELRETVRYRPAKSRFKIYIIDEVHMLTAEAFNALLKTLEEPPEHVLFIFATTEPHKIPSTILSRCQRFDFRRIPTPQLVEHLRNIAGREDTKLSDSVLYAIAGEADGSMRDAQSLLEQILAFSGDDLGDEEILDVLGVVDRRSVHRVTEAILLGDVKQCLDVVGDLHRRGIDSRRFCQQLCEHFRNLLVLALGSGEAQMDLPDEEKESLKHAVSKTTTESLYLYFQMMLKGEEEIRRSTIPRITLEMLLLRLSQLPKLESLEKVMGKLSSLENRLAEASVPEDAARTVQDSFSKISPPRVPVFAEPVIAPSAPEAPPPPQPEEPFIFEPPELIAPASSINRQPAISLEEVPGQWPAFLEWLNRKDAILSAKLNRSRIRKLSDTSFQVEVLEIYDNAFAEPQSMTRLEDAAADFFGRKFQWIIRGMDEKPDPRSSPGPGRKANPKRTVLEHPVVLQALEVLGGELVDIKPLKKDRDR
jgi:DNA polymerase III subunit gamma/tau